MAARLGVWALARFLHRNQLPGEKERNAPAARKDQFVVPRGYSLMALCSPWKAFFSFSPALGNPRCTKACQSPARPSLLGSLSSSETSRGLNLEWTVASAVLPTFARPERF